MKNYSHKPLLSVIVPIYNVEEFVEECLLSIVKQDYENIEIIAVNDGSKDNSLQILNDFANKYHCVTVYDKPNGGLSDTRNYGLDRCHGDYITFIDSDDVLLQTDIYSRIISCFETDDKLDAVQYDLIYKWNSDKEYKRNYPFRDYLGKEELLYGYLKQWIHVSCCDKVFRRKVFDTIRFPKGEISEDIAIIPQITSFVSKMAVTNIGDYGYRYREGSISTSVPGVLKIYSILSSYYKYLSCCMASTTSVKALAIDCYSKLLWSYTSILRQHHADSLIDFYKQKFFLRISLYSWIKYHSKDISVGEQIKSFIICVLGVKWAVKFQNLFTNNQ